jgi:HK97 family phage prohead protease
MDNIFERRIASLELRADSDSKGKVLEGIAARYNSVSGPIPTASGSTFREIIRPGAFRNVVANKQDVRMLIDHDASKVIGRTASGTLQLRDTPQGLAYRCVLPDTQSANDLHESVKRGDVNQCSFGFTLGERDCKYKNCDEDDLDDLSALDGLDDKDEPRALQMLGELRALGSFYEKDERRARKSGKRVLVRSIHNVSTLHEISAVAFPAYPTGTSIQARGESRSLVLPSPAQVLEQNVRALEYEIEQGSPRARRKDLLNVILS